MPFLQKKLLRNQPKKFTSLPKNLPGKLKKTRESVSKNPIACLSGMILDLDSYKSDQDSDEKLWDDFQTNSQKYSPKDSQEKSLGESEEEIPQDSDKVTEQTSEKDTDQESEKGTEQEAEKVTEQESEQEGEPNRGPKKRYFLPAKKLSEQNRKLNKKVIKVISSNKKI